MRRALRLALALVLAALPGLADVLVLKDGRRVEGEIVAETTKLVRIKTRLGELEFERAEIESIERGKTRREEFDERWEAARSAEDFFALGTWADEKRMRKETRKCMRKAVELDPQHAGAHTWLGHVEYRGEWMTPEERDQRMKADREAEMAARGLVRHGERWVTPAEKDKLERGLVLHEGRWMSFAEAQRMKGLELFGEAWIPRVEALARRDVARAEKLSGAGFAVAVSDQVILAGPVSVPVLEDVSQGLLRGRAWFDALYAVEPGLALFGGHLAEFYLFGKDAGAYEATVELFASWTDTVPEGWAEAVKQTHGYLYWDPFPLSSARRWHREDYDLTGHCYHHWGHLVLNRLGYDGRLLPPWYDESFAGLMENAIHGRNAVFCRAQAGPTSGTSAKGAVFSFDPKLLREGNWRGVLRDALEAHRVPAFDRLAQRSFSELELLDVATGMGILEWLSSLPEPEPGVPALSAFHRELRAGAPEVPFRVIESAHERQAVYDAAFRAAIGLDVRRADAVWRSWFLAR